MKLEVINNNCVSSLKGPAVALQQALMQVASQFLMAKDFTPLYTPFFMRKDVMQASGLCLCTG